MTDLTLFQMEDDEQAWVDSLENTPDEQQEEAEAKFAQFLEAKADKIDRVGAVLSSLDNVQVHARTEIARLRAREQAAEKNARRLEQYLLHILARRNGKPLKGHNITLFARRTEALIVDDPDAVPAQWKRTTINVDIPKEPVKRAIQAGETIPGVHIEPREHLVKR